MRQGYLADSTLSAASDRNQLDLSTALGVTPDGLVDHPMLFRGFVARPDVAAAGLLAVADVAASRYADAGLAKMLANLDPVVTSAGDRLRFESFSACNGVYARFDLLPDGIDAGDAEFGTTNVDINQPLRTALASVGRNELLHLSVGSDELRVSTPAHTFVEEQVVLPDRWVRGFAESPTIASRMTEVGEVSGVAAIKFLGGLSKSASPGADMTLSVRRTGLVPQLSEGPDTVRLIGARRVTAAARVVRYATRLRIFRDEFGASAWLFDLPGGRLTLMLTSGAYRGFSGQGALLVLLAGQDSDHIGTSLNSALAWKPSIAPGALATDLGLEADEIARGIAWLAASGRVGYDLDTHSWFHRDLPIDVERVLRRNPRLKAARDLVDRRQVERSGGAWHVVGSEGNIREVTLSPNDVTGGWTCTCHWFWKEGVGRGPCKHVLAALIASQ